MPLLLSRREVASIIDEANYKNLTFDQVIRRRASRWRLWSKNFRPERLCLSTTDKIAYNSPGTAITCTLASLAASTTVGRQSTVIDNTTNLYDDALVTLGVKTSSSAIGSSKTVAMYLLGSEDGTVFDGDDAQPGASDAGYAINSPSNLPLAQVLYCPTSAKTYYKTCSIALLKGGVMPKKWGIVVCNDTNQSLDSTEGNHQKTFNGITYTNS
jgi:hypothetical protein